MTKPGHRAGTVGPWAQEKLDALQAYLQFYCTVLKNQPFKRVYIDGFAGSPVTTVRASRTEAGRSSGWDEEDSEAQAEIVLGSPIRALSTDPGFDRHYFFDLDPARVAQLNDLKQAWPNKWIHVELADANAKIRQLVREIGYKRNVRGVAFLDPYGASLEWQTVADLGRTGHFEVLINLPLHMAINRLLAKDADRRPEWEAMVDRVFGCETWRSEVYDTKQDLFGETEEFKNDRVPARLLQFYLARLATVFPCVAPNPRLIRNTKGGPLYYLLWAGPHKKGLEGAAHILEDRMRLTRARRG